VVSGSSFPGVDLEEGEGEACGKTKAIDVTFTSSSHPPPSTPYNHHAAGCRPPPLAAFTTNCRPPPFAAIAPTAAALHHTSDAVRHPLPRG